jgi:hypothetical protein
MYVCLKNVFRKQSADDPIKLFSSFFSAALS